jgi:hypothetical protein
MFGDGGLTFREFATREVLPLATIHDAVLEFLCGRDDAVLCGAQAVNAYVDDSRMTHDVDILSPRAHELPREIQTFVSRRFRIAVRVNSCRGGIHHRLYQVRRPTHRHFVDIRRVDHLPPVERVENVLVVAPPELIAQKIVASECRKLTPRAGTDLADVWRVLLTFPELKAREGPVRERLHAAGASPDVLAAWDDVVAQTILPEDEDGEF